jgi:hypothetical protein
VIAHLCYMRIRFGILRNTDVKIPDYYYDYYIHDMIMPFALHITFTVHGAPLRLLSLVVSSCQSMFVDASGRNGVELMKTP